MGCTTQAIAGGELIEVGVGLLESMDEITPGGRFSGFGRSPVSTAVILLYQNSQNPFPIKFLDILHPCGVVQLVERLVHTQEVGGSSPLSATKDA